MTCCQPSRSDWPRSGSTAHRRESEWALSRQSTHIQTCKFPASQNLQPLAPNHESFQSRLSSRAQRGILVLAGGGNNDCAGKNQGPSLALGMTKCLGYSRSRDCLEVGRNLDHSLLNRPHDQLSFIVDSELAHQIELMCVHGLAA